MINNCKMNGSLAEWQGSVSKYCNGNSRLAFAVSCAFAAPLLSIARGENGGFNLFGPSSIGKTTALRVAASVYGPKNYVQQWRATSNGLEGVAAAHNDMLLVLDEMGQANPKEIGNTVYCLGNGSGKIRSNVRGDARTVKSWNSIYLSSGETTLADHIETEGKYAKAGQEVRLIDIPADTGSYGIFENLHGFYSGAELAKEISKYTDLYHGTAFIAYINALGQVRREDIIKHIGDINRRFIDDLPFNCSGQAVRVAGKFGFVAAAGELATNLGITGWDKYHARRSAAKCLDTWIQYRGGVIQQEEVSILRVLKKFLELHGCSRFADYEYDSRLTIHNMVGYKKRDESDESQHYFITIEAFRSEIYKGYNIKQVEQVLHARGVLIPEKGSKHMTRSERIQGVNQRCYRIDAKILTMEF